MAQRVIINIEYLRNINLTEPLIETTMVEGKLIFQDGEAVLMYIDSVGDDSRDSDFNRLGLPVQGLIAINEASVVLTRKDDVQPLLVFEKGLTYNSVYNVPFGVLSNKYFTSAVETSIGETSGKARIVYHAYGPMHKHSEIEMRIYYSVVKSAVMLNMSPAFERHRGLGLEL